MVGITLSAPQAEEARRRAGAAGVGDKVDIRVMDYRHLAGEASPGCSGRAAGC